MSLASRVAAVSLVTAMSLVVLSGCHSAGLVRNATTTPRRGDVDGVQAVVEPYAGGFELKLALNLPPANIDYSAKREGRVVRIEIHEGHYNEKCVDPYDVLLDVGPLEPGDYDVVVWVSSPWMDEDSQLLATHATVPAGATTPRRVAGTSSFRAIGCR
jgi:hypothetical protein